MMKKKRHIESHDQQEDVIFFFFVPFMMIDHEIGGAGALKHQFLSLVFFCLAQHSQYHRLAYIV